MAIKYFCDKCNSELNKVSLRDINIPYLDNDSTILHKELCINCLRKLHEWLKPDMISEKK